ncbi:signal peptidase I [Yoonia sp. 208BN28-4]|uniref:signal peptidase I n=1 Tax=Yoonia sp. 208BN28-4 TaxID=3126505 RepID=UPI0030ACBE66
MIRTLAALALLSGPAAAQSVCVCLECITGPFDRYAPVSGSMKPTLEPGQCIIVRTDFDNVAAGDVVTHLAFDQTYLSRVVGLAGQSVQMSGGALIIDGAPVPRVPQPDYRQVMQREAGSVPRCPVPTPMTDHCLILRHTETLGGVSYDTLDLGASRGDDTGIFIVPAGYVFVLGDNRDNAVDSRMAPAQGGFGFVALTDVTGVLHEIRE